MTPYSVFLSALYVFIFWFRGLQGYTNNSLFLLKGNDLIIEIETPKTKVKVFQWKSKIRSKEFTIVTYFPDSKFLNNDFGERAEFSTEKYSLQIKNLALDESGLYQAVDASNEVLIIADYHVTVQEQVSPVVLNVSPGSPSSESCKLTVTCSTQSSSLNSTFTCTPRTCSGDGGDPAEVVTSDARLNLYLSNGSIGICNHSNKVSRSKATMEIKPLCFKEAVFHDNNSNYEKLIILCRSVLVIPIIILVIFYCWRKNNNHLKGHSDQSPNCDQAAAVYMNVSLLGAPPLPLEPADMELNLIRA
ncbi:uncharacterized protein LOC132462418 [Gadus macrocephalus]|uniref:uncharacterized protein LOC132462418 n=1 Tax=Gadus macrocephalus TaxID=80720 RepID=UPI0028CB8FF2|nr:uncharacterized protein LOC132462418 [Gadus macrocephalus]